MCRTYGARESYVFRTQRFRAGLNCSAPMALGEGLPMLGRENDSVIETYLEHAELAAEKRPPGRRPLRRRVQRRPHLDGGAAGGIAKLSEVEEAEAGETKVLEEALLDVLAFELD
jgi:hypothetical protein